MSAGAPLEAASRKLRGVPGFPARIGRPRKEPDGDNHGDTRRTAPELAAGQGEMARAESALASQATAEKLKTPRERALAVVAALWPRLLTIEQVCRYLSLGADVVLELERAGVLSRVHVPAPVTARRRGGEIRRALYDREALDRAIDAWRDRP